jgi:DNA-binding SARP family transcriptional activator/ABC-type branched-subunit amino acid transport system substrate-binding protein
VERLQFGQSQLQTALVKMEFRILGPLQVLDDGQPVEIGGRKQRALLAVLLLHANEVVSVDTLIDELWGERPPPTAAKTLQSHVSRLRSALPNVAIDTRGHGYVLRIEPRQLDADAYADMLEEARRRLADADPERAGELLRQALGLWRGKPLADFTYEPFAQRPIARLEELRLGGIEERIEADLQVGRHATLVPELDALVAENPLRERLVGQLMVALYRSQRQAEALAAYERARQRFAEELGLEPSERLQRLHRQILEHDAALAVPERARPRFVPIPVWRHPRRLIAAGVLVLGAAAVGIALGVSGGGPATRVAGALALDPRTGDVQDDVPLGSSPSSVAIGNGSVWVLDADDRTISEVDAGRRKLRRTFSIESVPADVAVGAGAVWIASAVGASSPADESFPQSVSRVDSESGEVDATISLPRSPGGHQFGVLPGLSRRRIALTHDAVWAINPDGSVSRIDIATNRLVKTIRGVEAENIAAGDGQVWVTEDATLVQIDPDLNAVSRRIEVSEDTLGELAIGAGSVWVADPFGGKVWRIASQPPIVKRAIPVKLWVASVAFADGVVWAANEIADEVYRIDPRSNAATVASRVFAPRAIAAGNGTVWVTAGSPPSPDAALPAPICGPVIYGGSGKPDVLIVSDLPLKGVSRAVTQAMVRGVRLVLRQRRFDAGGYSVGYQSCDSATAQGGMSDFFRCGMNAKAYARNLSVVAVFGSFNSYCSFLQIPITNRAPQGPLAMISPSNTFPFLTRDKGLYPNGVRNYVRIAGADHLQAVAHAEFVRRLRRHALFVLSPAGVADDREFAANVEKAAHRLRLTVVGSATFDPESGDYGALARRVARATPDAVVVAGILVPATGRLIRDLRAAVGPDVAIVVPDGFNLIDDLLKLAGPAAQGLYVSNYGIPNSHLPPRGRRLLAEYTQVYGTPGPDLAAVYGAQAAQILLDAIARSDGTRASVTTELRRTRVENGILGDIRFDRRGDLVEAPFTFFRVAGRSFVADRVIRARSALLER